METHRWSRHGITRASGTVAGAHRELSTGRTWATRAILALALALGGLAVAAAASPGHSGGGVAQASAHPWMY